VRLTSDFTERGTVTVINMVDELVYETPLQTNNDELLGLNVTAGMYLVTVNTNHGKFVRKITVTR
jgi:hypothetical protein